MQDCLFGHGPPAFDAQLRGVKRIELAQAAWIEHLPAWVDGHQTLYRELETHAPWEQHRRDMYERTVDVPRLTAPAPTEGRAGAVIKALASALSAHYGAALESISLAWYRDGRDSVAFHGDKIGRHTRRSVIAIVSLGAPRRFLLRPLSGGPSKAFSLGWGDLLVMGGSCQRTWQHGVPKTSQAEPRMSVVFRPSSA